MTSRTAQRTHRAEKDVAAPARRRGLRLLLGGLAALVLIGLVTAGLFTSRPVESTATTAAPDFTLTDTSGETVSLADFRGQPVILYFSEGAGCQSCLVQMAAIEKMAGQYSAAGFTVLPIVMNSREDILADMQANGVRTPFLLDDGTVSTAYGTLGHGMHAGLPGHSFVVIDADGQQRWYGEYPSMWLDPEELLKTAQAKL